MAFTLTSNQVPAPTGPTTALTVMAGPAAPITAIPYETTFLVQTNAAVAQLEVGGRLGAGVYGVGVDPANTTNLAITITGTGLTATVKAGRAMMDSAVEVAEDSPVTCGDNARTFIWLTQGAVPTPVTSSRTPPAGNVVLLGSVLCQGGNTISVDYSGVVRLQPGTTGIRGVADTGAPVDTPPTWWSGLTQTAFGVYWWDGSAYHLMDLPDGSVTTQKIAAGAVTDPTIGTGQVTARALAANAAVLSLADRDGVALTGALALLDGDGVDIDRLGANAFVISSRTQELLRRLLRANLLTFGTDIFQDDALLLEEAVISLDMAS